MTPTTTSTGRDASTPTVGTLRTLIMSAGSTLLAGFVSWLSGAVTVTPDGMVITIKWAALAAVLSTGTLTAVDAIRRKAAANRVTATHG